MFAILRPSASLGHLHDLTITPLCAKLRAQLHPYETVALSVNDQESLFLLLECNHAIDIDAPQGDVDELDDMLGMSAVDDGQGAEGMLCVVNERVTNFLANHFGANNNAELWKFPLFALRASERESNGSYRVAVKLVQGWKDNGCIASIEKYLRESIAPRTLFDKGHLAIHSDRTWLKSMLQRKLMHRRVVTGGLLQVELLGNHIVLQVDHIVDCENGNILGMWCEVEGGRILQSIDIDRACDIDIITTDNEESGASTADQNTALMNSKEIVDTLEEENVTGMDDTSLEILNTLEMIFSKGRHQMHMLDNLPHAILVHGAEGTGKTKLCKAIGKILGKRHGIRFIEIDGVSIAMKIELGQGAELENWLDQKIVGCMENKVLVLIDNIDLVCPGNSNSLRPTQLQALSFLFKFFDTIRATHVHEKRICVLSTAVSSDNVDRSLLKPGRLDRDVHVPIPGTRQRQTLLRLLLTQFFKLEDDKKEMLVDEVLPLTAGFVARDLERLCRMAVLHMMGDISDDQGLSGHFRYALRVVRPSQLSDYGARIPAIDWDQVGGYDKQKKRCRETMYFPLHYPESFKKLNLPTASGLLLYGPSGCGKTHLVKALASLGKMNYFAIKCPEIFSKYTGDTEAMIRDIFRKARQLEPCVLVFDEIDALAGKRDDDSGSATSDSGSSRRALSQLLTEIDGIQQRKSVFLVGCTNRKEELDDAILRPGRLEHLVYMGMPEKSDRLAIMRVIIKNMPLDDSVDLEAMAEDDMTEGFTGADLYGLCREAAIEALREDIDGNTIRQEFFDNVLQSMKSKNA